MDNTFIVEKKLSECLEIVKLLVKKHKLGKMYFERAEDKDTKEFFCFVISFEFGSDTIRFPLAIDTFGRAWMVLKDGVGGIEKVPFTFQNFELGFALELKAKGFIKTPKNK